MDRLDLQKLRDLPIEGVAERLGMEVVRHKALCPFHDDHHASLSFSLRRNTFRCFVCGAHGGVIDLVMQHRRMNFREAVEWLSNGNVNVNGNYMYNENLKSPTSNLKPFNAFYYARFFEHPWLNDAARRFLFDERRLDERVVKWCRLTSWRDRHGTEWLQIPYFAEDGTLMGIQNRNLTPGAQPRFRFPQGSQCGIYNLPVLRMLKPHDELWITEGCSDCWAMLSSGRKAIAIPSATLVSTLTGTGTNNLHNRLKLALTLGLSLKMYPDRDEPGERLFLQLKELLPTLEHHQLPPDCKDFGEMYLKSKK